MEKTRDVAIVGMSLVLPGASSVGAYWTNLANGYDAIKECPPDVIESFYFGAKDNSIIDRFYCAKGGFIDLGITDPLRYGILPVAAEGADPDQIVSLMLTDMALADAGIMHKGISLKNACCIIGKGGFAGLPQLTSSEIIRSSQTVHSMIRNALPDLPEDVAEGIKRDYQTRFGRYGGDTVTSSMPNLVACGVANHFDMYGPAYTIDAACASSIVALEHGVRLLRNGSCDIAVIGGMHTAQSSVFWSAFNVMGALSHRETIAPFSKDADGLLIGQGAGFVICKMLDRAIQDEDRIYAVIRGVAVGSDGGGNNVLVTNADGQTRTVDAAWKDAGMDPKEIALIEAHGTGTPIGDGTELMAMTDYFGDQSHRKAYIGSVKSMIGHTMPAAGIAGLIKTALALHHRQIPPTLHCERPLDAFGRSRFNPAQELVDWEAEGLPLIAGVNAFGFGGINAHAVVTGYEEPPAHRTRYSVDKRRHGWPMLIAVAAENKEDLLTKIDLTKFKNRIGSIAGKESDPYRLVLFDPTGDRLKKAVEIVEKDEPCFGEDDIWFTNKPLLFNGGKFAFMFPGPVTMEEIERDSLYDELSLAMAVDQASNDLMASEWAANSDADENARNRQFIEQLKDDPDHPQRPQLVAPQIINAAFQSTGVTPAAYLGDGTGEWNALRASGMFDSSFDQVVTTMTEDSANQIDPELIPDFHTYEVDPAGRKVKLDEIVASLEDVFTTSDLSPNRVFLCALADAADDLVAALDKEKFSYTEIELATGAGANTPYAEALVEPIMERLDGLVVQEGRAPVYSAATVSKIESGTSLSQDFLTAELARTTHFRLLVDKLYREENIKMFIQVGGGALEDVIKETLGDKDDYVTISAAKTGRHTIDQMRRVHAALFIQGGPCNLLFMGVPEEMRNTQSIFLVPSGARLLLDLESFDTAVREYYVPKAKAGVLPELDLPEGEEANPIVEAMSDNLQDALKQQSEIVKLFQKQGKLTGKGETLRRGSLRGTTVPIQPINHTGEENDPVVAKAAPAKAAPAKATPEAEPEGAMTYPWQVGPIKPHPKGKKRIGTKFEVPMHVGLDNYPALEDHSIVYQPVGWPYQDDMVPVIPGAGMMEILAEAALTQVPDMKVVKFGSFSAMNFCPANPAFDQTIRGIWKAENKVLLTIDGFAQMEVTVADEFEEPPADLMDKLSNDIGETYEPPLTVERAYDIAFHRERYQSLKEMTRCADKGYDMVIKAEEGKGSLLDNMGQVVGWYLHHHETYNQVSFPVRINSIRFYDDFRDQSGTFRSICLIKSLSENFITSDLAFARDGKVWCYCRGWINNRMPMEDSTYNVTMNPESNLSIKPIDEAANVFSYRNEYPMQQALLFLGIRYLSYPEREEGWGLVDQELSTNAQASDIQLQYIYSRVISKDMVRWWLRDENGEMRWPIEFWAQHDMAGKMIMKDRAGDDIPGVPQFSIAHKDDQTVGIVADKPVGIDVELIEEKDPGFWNLTYTDHERELLEGLGNTPEWAIRFWVAKEAYGKMLGVGLAGNPKKHEVERVEGENLFISGVKITTQVRDENYILGWTVVD
ncbi:MAG: 4'-phosphopantetheinyl transferase superfamily protein [Propionibacteriaceae bacterium]|jgi:3-oxoacyl-(acyl-carrier-protein) synthase|nr:4'-phosphopantetheinyl transferase superfamily protein [Propionibacteriaceae bacterium]